MRDHLPRYTLRIPRELLDKLHSLAEYNGRTVNKELELLIKRSITEFEQEMGPLPNHPNKDKV